MAKARSLNKVTLIGNLTRDPILKNTSGGVTVCTFGIATNSSWRDADGTTKERAEFHNIVAWNKLADVCAQILGVGMLVYLEGELRTRAWTGDDGEKRYRTEVKLDDMILLDAKERKAVGVDKAQELGEKAPQETVESAEEKVPEVTDKETVAKAAENSAPQVDVNDDDLF